MLALHLATCGDEEIPGRARDLSTLRVWLTGELDVVVKDMIQSTACDGLISRLATAFEAVPPNERGSVVSTARRDTNWLDNPRLAALFRAGDDCLSFEALRDERQKVSVFVCMPGDLIPVYPQVCRLLTTFALDAMMNRLTGRAQPVMFILDELAQIGHLPIVQRAFTLGAGYGVQAWAVFQSIEDARRLYPLDTLYGSSGIRCFFNLPDPQSAEFASKCAAGVLSPGDVQRLGRFEMLTLLDGENPMLIERLGASYERDQRASKP
jgi:type IV secretion system protein VirD4